MLSWCRRRSDEAWCYDRFFFFFFFFFLIRREVEYLKEREAWDITKRKYRDIPFDNISCFSLFFFFSNQETLTSACTIITYLHRLHWFSATFQRKYRKITIYRSPLFSASGQSMVAINKRLPLLAPIWLRLYFCQGFFFLSCLFSVFV